MTKNILDNIHNKNLQSIADKVVQNIPVSEEDALYTLTTNDILELGLIAHYIKTELHGNKAFYGVNMNLNYTNICELRCPLCAFSKDEGDKGAYVLSIEDIKTKVAGAVALGIDEVHIVGGLYPQLKIDYFEEMLRAIKEIKPDIFIVAFTATEFEYFARINDLPLMEVFDKMIKAGLDALPGGGAEIFAPKVRDIIAPKKISGKHWLDVMRTAHSMGLKTNATMLYNHIEKPCDIVDHLSKIRSLQDETGGFKTFVPLLYHDKKTKIPACRNTKGGYNDIRIYATSRIFLHNVSHIKGLWMYLGEKMAQVLLSFGVDDIGSTYNYERVVHAAGAKTPDCGTEPYLRNLIENAGLTPLRTASNYETIKNKSS